MNAGSETNDFSSSLSSGQIEILQHQIRQFKSLGKRFNESRLPKIIEEVNNRANDQTSVKVLPKQVEHEVPVPALSWQCFNALLFYGPPKSPQDGAISFASSVSCSHI